MAVLVSAWDARVATALSGSAYHLAPLVVTVGNNLGLYGRKKICRATCQMIGAALVASVVFLLTFFMSLAVEGNCPPPPAWRSAERDQYDVDIIFGERDKSIYSRKNNSHNRCKLIPNPFGMDTSKRPLRGKTENFRLRT